MAVSGLGSVVIPEEDGLLPVHQSLAVGKQVEIVADEHLDVGLGEHGQRVLVKEDEDVSLIEDGGQHNDDGDSAVEEEPEAIGAVLDELQLLGQIRGTAELLGWDLEVFQDIAWHFHEHDLQIMINCDGAI